MADLLRTLAADEGVRMAAAFLAPWIPFGLGYWIGHGEGRRIEKQHQNRRTHQ